MNKNQTLQGFRILNTRPVSQAASLTQALQALGASVIECPALRITPLNTPWEKACLPLTQYQSAIFISPNAAEHFFKRISPKAWPQQSIAIAMGEATAQALKVNGIRAIKPTDSTTEGLLTMPALHNVDKKNILLVKGEEGRPDLFQALTEKGARVQKLSVYKRSMPNFNPEFIKGLWQDNLIDIILFTSQQAMIQLFEMFGEKAHTWLQDKPCLVISQRLALIAKSKGIKTVFITPPHQLSEGFVNAYQRLNARTAHDR